MRNYFRHVGRRAKGRKMSSTLVPVSAPKPKPPAAILSFLCSVFGGTGVRSGAAGRRWRSSPKGFAASKQRTNETGIIYP